MTIVNKGRRDDVARLAALIDQKKTPIAAQNSQEDESSWVPVEEEDSQEPLLDGNIVDEN
jgi:hypothetical protein